MTVQIRASEGPNLPVDEVRQPTHRKWPIFICYRQADAMDTAGRLHELLHRRAVPLIASEGEAAVAETVELDAYFDQTAELVGDWTEIHEPHLKRSRAFIIVCSPGAKLVDGPDDWVHKEIDWWLDNRAVPPILVDPLAQQSRYVPTRVADRWPNAQRIEVSEDDWGDKEALRRIRDRLIASIFSSGRSIYQKELEEEKRRARELSEALVTQRSLSRKLVFALLATGLFLCAAAVAAAYAYQANVRLDESLLTIKGVLRNSLIKEAFSACTERSLNGRYAGLDAIVRARAIRPGEDLNQVTSHCLEKFGMRPTSAEPRSKAIRDAVDENIVSQPDSWEVTSAHWQRFVRVRNTANIDESTIEIGETGPHQMSWTVPIPSDHIASVRFHPKRPFIAVSVPNFSRGHKVVLLDFERRIKMTELELDDHFNSLSGSPSFDSLRFSGSGRFLAGGGAGGQVRVWDLHEPRPFEPKRGFPPILLAQRGFASAAKTVTFSPNEDVLLTTSEHGDVQAWSIQDAALLAQAKLGTEMHNGTESVEWSRDGHLWLGDRAWEIVSPLGIALRAPPNKFGGDSSVADIEFSRDGLQMAVAAEHASPLVYSLVEPISAVELVTRDDATEIAFGPGQRQLTAFDLSSSMTLDLDRPERTPDEHRDFTRNPKHALSYSGGSVLVAGSEDTIIARIVDLNTGGVHRSAAFRGTFLTPLLPKFNRSDTEFALPYDAANGLTVRIMNVSTLGTERLVSLEDDRDDLLTLTDGSFGLLSADKLSVRNLRSDRLTPGIRGQRLGVEGYLPHYTSSQDGRLIAEILGDGKVVIWDLHTRRQRLVISRAALPEEQWLAFDDTAQRLAIFAAGTGTVYDLSTGAASKPLRSEAVAACFLDAPKVALRVVERDGRVFDWSPSTSEVTEVVHLPDWEPDRFVIALWGKGGRRLVLVDSPILMWDQEAAWKRASYGHDLGRPERGTLSADGTKVFMSREGEVVKVWDQARGVDLLELGLAPNYVHDTNLRLLSGTQLLIWARDSKVSLHDVRSKSAIFERVLSSTAKCVAGDETGATLAVCLDHQVALLDDHGKDVGALRLENANPIDVCLTADGKLLASIDDAHSVTLWNVAKRSQIVAFNLGSELTRVALTPDGKRLAIGDKKGIVRLWPLDELFSHLHRASTPASEPN